ncbi:MAG: hypothetical protein PHU72_00065 [Dethiosulfovibrio sp.]|nr:hypothetical protein [Dethiosulfovibrio sp.]
MDCHLLLELPIDGLNSPLQSVELVFNGRNSLIGIDSCYWLSSEISFPKKPKPYPNQSYYSQGP